MGRQTLPTGPIVQLGSFLSGVLNGIFILLRSLLLRFDFFYHLSSEGKTLVAFSGYWPAFFWVCLGQVRSLTTTMGCLALKPLHLERPRSMRTLSLWFLILF